MCLADLTPQTTPPTPAAKASGSSTTKPSPSDVNADLILRRAGRHHFAFLKGYLEGLDIRDMAWRYLETCESPDIDLRSVFTTLKWIRTDLKSLAKRHGKFAYARVIAINPEQLPVVDRSVPTLDEYREDRDPYEMYSEADLLELFHDEYGGGNAGAGDTKSQRNVRLRRKQAEALVWFEALVKTAPTLDDGVDGWLVPALANRLITSGITTIRDLLATINGRGQRWYIGINQIGEKASARIMKWLELNQDVLGTPIGPQALVKRSLLDVSTVTKLRPKQFGIVPLEYFRPRPDMDGSHGENRGVRNRSGVENDYEAIELWLSTITVPNTKRSYRKEAERFLLWSLLERGKPISSMMASDCIAYRDFLWDLGRLTDESWSVIYKIPQKNWLGKRGTERWSELWRPFEQLPPLTPPKNLSPEERIAWMEQAMKTRNIGVLAPSSQKVAQVTLKAMCEWLMRQRYLDSNPWDGVPPRLKTAAKVQIDRSFTQSQWAFLMGFLDQMPRDARYARLRFILIFAYGTGLRLSELTGALISDLKYRSTSGARKSAWTMNVIGKGMKERVVVIPSVVMKELELYLAHRKYHSLADAPPDAPLIDRLVGIPSPALPINGKKAFEIQAKMSDNRLYAILKTFFSQVAEAMHKESPQEAKHVQAASTHWLRHTCGSHAVANGVPIEVLQINFGHSSVDTTSIYITAEIDRRIEEMEKFMDRTSANYGVDLS